MIADGAALVEKGKSVFCFNKRDLLLVRQILTPMAPVSEFKVRSAKIAWKRLCRYFGRSVVYIVV